MSEPPPALRLRTIGFKVDTDDLSTPPPPGISLWFYC